MSSYLDLTEDMFKRKSSGLMIIRVEETFLLFGEECTGGGPKLLGAVTKEGLGDIAHAGEETRLSSALFEQT